MANQGCVGRCVEVRETQDPVLEVARLGQRVGGPRDQVRSPGAGASSTELLAAAEARGHDLSLLRVGRFVFCLFFFF